VARSQHQKVEIKHPITGKLYRVETPKGTIHPKRLVRAMELIIAGGEHELLIKLLEPYKHRPELIKSAFKVMFVLGGMSHESSEPANQ